MLMEPIMGLQIVQVACKQATRTRQPEPGSQRARSRQPVSQKQATRSRQPVSQKRAASSRQPELFRVLKFREDS